jgi:hypothetical protein|tara:strand:- start:1541 stop:1816 length:276 start_codon:yes stop_codon:yes gene_type:complete
MILNLISIFSGFLFSSIIDTSLGEFNEWAIVGASLIVATTESFNNLYYLIIKKTREKDVNKAGTFNLLDSLNNFKIGILYGLIVDGFKLGS